jgi:hypothetical protein
MLGIAFAEIGPRPETERSFWHVDRSLSQADRPALTLTDLCYQRAIKNIEKELRNSSKRIPELTEELSGVESVVILPVRSVVMLP